MHSPGDQRGGQHGWSGRPAAEPRTTTAAALLSLAIGAAAACLAVLVVTAATRPRPGTTGAAAIQPASPPSTAALPAPRTLVGAGSCTSSGCHAAPVAGHAPWQSSYTVWAARDPHARAHAVLREPLAEAIVAALAAGAPGRAAVPAAENVACIGCHATGRGHRSAEGVGCESCHGAASDWLVAHALPGWRTAGNQMGMIDLADPFVAAEQCAGCHVGGPPTDDGAPREVSHDLIAAGHPRLAFELRSFKEAEPPHWRDRFAAPSGNQATAAATLDPVDEWALGRLGALGTFVGQLARQVAATDRKSPHAPVAAVWPEFTAFDCYGCHRPALVGPTGGATQPGPLGTPRLEPLHWALLDVIAPAGAGAGLQTFRDDIEGRWWRPPDSTALAACAAAIAAARTRGHASLAALPAGPLADRIAAGVNPADWDEAAAGLAALRAVADRAAARGATQAALAPARERQERLHRLLEFPAGIDGGRPGRFDSPHEYDAAAVGAALAEAAAALAGLP